MPTTTEALHQRARTSGVNPILYRIARLILVPFFRLYFRLERHGIPNVPTEGPLLLASNHRSFLDPFIIGASLKRPVYYVAKKELFARPWQAWVLNGLGAFPVDRGASDQHMLETARRILARGDVVVIFPEGTRVRPGGLANPKRGIGRLALESGAPVVPVALTGTEAIRKGWRIRPHRVRIRCGRPLTFPRVENPSKQLAQAVTDRVWPCVALQWEWLGGLPPLRTAVVHGTTERAHALAATLEGAGLQVTRDADAVADAQDAVTLTVPRAGRAPVMATQGANVARLGAPDGEGSTVIVSTDRAFAAQVRKALADGGLASRVTSDPAELGRGRLTEAPAADRVRAAA